jgi:hypothetical protein
MMLQHLHELLPKFLELYDPTPRDLDEIKKAFEKRLSFYEEQLSEKGLICVENCLIDLIWLAKEKDIHAINYLKFIDQQCEVLLELTSPNTRSRFKKTLREMFINHDNTQSRMKSYIAEICVAARLLSSGRISLVAVEERLSNGKSLDFTFDENGKSLYVEVESIEIAPGKVESAEGLKKFLEKRATDKFQAKLAGIQSNEISVNVTHVLWGRVSDLDK